MDKTSQLIIDDSKFLSEIVTKQEMDFDKIMKYSPVDLKLLRKLYLGDYNFTSDNMIILINHLNYLNSDKIIEMLILLHFTDKTKLNKDNFNNDILSVYNKIELHDKNNTLTKYGCLDILKFLHDNNKLYISLEMFQIACENGYLNIIEFIHRINKTYTNDNVSFRLACANGHLNVVRFIYNICGFSSQFKYIYLQDACIYGHVNIVKFLYNLDTVDGKWISKYFLRDVCARGHFDVFKFLYVNNDIKNTNEYLFQLACELRHYDISKWILLNE